MAEPLYWVFVPGAAAMIAALLTPVGLGIRTLVRWRGRRRNRHARCSRCNASLADALEQSELFVVEGLHVCPRCASALRLRLWVLIPTAGFLTVTALVGSGLGFLLSDAQLDWWLNVRLVALLLPTTGLALGLTGGIFLMKRANRKALWNVGSAPQVIENGSDLSVFSSAPSDS